MIKRNDLVKEFELVVKQELKNHKDSKLATNLSINNLRKSVEALSLKMDSRYSKLESELNIQSSDYQTLENSFERFREWKNSQDRDLAAKQEEILEELKETSKRLDFSFREQDSIKDRMTEIIDSIANCEKKNKYLEYHLGVEVQRTKKYFDSALKLLKTEILSIPSEAEAVKKMILDKMEIQHVDFSGLTRDLTFYKKNIYVIEKNIENIYNIIERLKKG